MTLKLPASSVRPVVFFTQTARSGRVELLPAFHSETLSDGDVDARIGTSAD